MTIDQHEVDATGRRNTYVMLEPTPGEEAYMLARGLIPDTRNTAWYDEWEKVKTSWDLNKSQRAEYRALGLDKSGHTPASSSSVETLLSGEKSPVTKLIESASEKMRHQ